METGDTKFGTNVSNKISLNSTLSELSKENKQGMGRGVVQLPLRPRLGLK